MSNDTHTALMMAKCLVVNRRNAESVSIFRPSLGLVFSVLGEEVGVFYDLSRTIPFVFRPESNSTHWKISFPMHYTYSIRAQKRAEKIPIYLCLIHYFHFLLLCMRRTSHGSALNNSQIRLVVVSLCAIFHSVEWSAFTYAACRNNKMLTI